jgi:hypothetical protein
MSTISRELPKTVEGRQMALTSAKNKEATLPVGTIIISAATKTRLLSIFSLYNSAILNLATANTNSTGATRQKNEAQVLARLWTSHFYQALNNAIDRKLYSPEVRAYFLLPVSSGAVPIMDSEEKLTLWGGRVQTGNTAMIGAGLEAIPFPSADEVKVFVDAYNALLATQSTAITETDNAEEAIDTLNIEADKVIKKVWDEVETFYNEETPESMRNNARQWGVKYVTLGESTNITFKAERADTHAGIEAAVFKFISIGVKHTAGPDGDIEIETRLVGEEPVICTHPDYVSVTQTITIVEGEAMTVTFVMVPVV